MRVVPRNAALPVAAGLVLAGACGGTVIRTDDTDSASGATDSSGGAASEDRGDAGGQALGGQASGAGGSGAQCGMLDGPVACGVEAAELAAQTVDLLLVLDASGSMSSIREPLGSTLWAGLTDALGATMTNGVRAIHYGLQIFPYTEEPSDPIPFECGDVRRCCEMPDHAEMLVPTVHPSVGVPWILEEMQDHHPAGAAAVTPALERAHRYFAEGNPPPNGDERYVLVVSDGAPICNPYAECDADTCTANLEELDGCPPEGPSCCDDLPAACLDDAASVEQIDALRAIGVTTIVMGLPGSERYAAVLQRLADAGGFVKGDGSTDFYAVSVDDGLDDLLRGLREITSLAAQPCHFSVPSEMTDSDAANVLVDCVLIPYTTGDDPFGGWHWDDPDDPSEFVFTGEICDRMRGPGVGEIHVVFGCAPPPIY